MQQLARSSASSEVNTAWNCIILAQRSLREKPRLLDSELSTDFAAHLASDASGPGDPGARDHP